VINVGIGFVPPVLENMKALTAIIAVNAASVHMDIFRVRNV
jgi:hypothetical protein